MAFLKTLTRDVETPQFLKEVGFLHGKHDLRFHYALDGEWYTLPRCMRDTLPAKWEVEQQDPCEPIAPAVKPQKNCFRLEENASPEYSCEEDDKMIPFKSESIHPEVWALIPGEPEMRLVPWEHIERTILTPHPEVWESIPGEPGMRLVPWQQVEREDIFHLPFWEKKWLGNTSILIG